MLVEAVFRGLSAGVGNLVAEGDIKLIKSIFWQIVTARLFLAGLICSGWTGPKYHRTASIT